MYMYTAVHPYPRSKSADGEACDACRVRCICTNNCRYSIQVQYLYTPIKFVFRVCIKFVFNICMLYSVLHSYR